MAVIIVMLMSCQAVKVNGELHTKLTGNPINGSRDSDAPPLVCD